MSQSQDMAAINNFFHNTRPKTQSAAQQKAAWAPWFKKLTWAQRNMNSDTLANAKAKRDAYNVANGTPSSKTALTQRDVNATIAQRLGVDPNPTVRAPTQPPAKMPTLRKGSKGEPVKTWQRKINIEPRGNFDNATEAVTKVWQTQHGLKPDGVVGPKTWMAGYVTDPSPGVIPMAIDDSTGELPSAKAEPVKKDLLNHVVAMGKKVYAKGEDPKTTDLAKTASEVESSKAGMSIVPKTVVGVGIYAAVVGSIIYALKRARKI